MLRICKFVCFSGGLDKHKKKKVICWLRKKSQIKIKSFDQSQGGKKTHHLNICHCTALRFAFDVAFKQGDQKWTKFKGGYNSTE